MDAKALVAQALREYFASDVPLSNAEDPARFRVQMMCGSDSDDGDATAAVEEDATEDSPSASSTVEGVLSSFSSPAAYVDQLAVVLASWYVTKQNPMLQLPEAIAGVAEAPSSREMLLSLPMEVVDDCIEQIITSEGTHSRVERTAAFIERLGGARGVLTLLGFRQTVGSHNTCPLTRAQCLDSFQQRHGKVKLTVGARAFTKHCERSSDGWWGPLKGNDERKNQVALAKLEQILDGGVWKNVHSLSHAHVTMEIRNALGFGARWTVEDQVFRGFLEPQMANGHDMRWRH